MGVEIKRQIHTPDIGICNVCLEDGGLVLSGHTSFSGSVPVNYDRYLGPALFEPYAADLVARIPRSDGVSVLELACGTGRVTRRLRESLPETASLVATDLNEPMLDFARASVPDPGVTWEAADAQSLPFADDSFDAVVCQFGLMFVPDKAQALREARRVLAAGGVFVASVWEPVAVHPHMRAIVVALEDLFPDSPPRFFEVPHGYNDRSRIRGDFEAAGWQDVEIELVRISGESPSAHDLAVGFAAGTPLAHELVERGADPAVVADRLAVELGDAAPYRVELAALLLTATK